MPASYVNTVHHTPTPTITHQRRPLKQASPAHRKNPHRRSRAQLEIFPDPSPPPRRTPQQTNQLSRMPRSKRAKVVHLSKTEKKGKDHTLKLFGLIRDSVDEYRYCFVFAVENMRNTYLKDVRTEFGDSRLFFGKTKVMAKALGTTPEDEHAPTLSALSKHVTGTVGLLFTSREPQSILEYFSSYAPLDYARAGTVASRTFTVPAGTVHSRGGEISAEEDVPLAHSLEVAVRKLGMPTKLVKGKVELENEYTVCREGEVLNSSQTALLKTFGVVTAEFRVDVKAYWSAAKREVTEIGPMEVEES